jgi:hypothetical protein
MPLLNRLLWAKLDVLPKKLFNKMLAMLTCKTFFTQATAEKMKRLKELNGLRTKPIKLDHRIRKIAMQSVHNAFHYEALAYAYTVQNNGLQEFLTARIKELDRIIQSNIIE